MQLSNTTDDINIAGTFEIANAGSGGRGVGIRVINIPDAGSYDDRDVYIRLSKYCHANVTIYIEGNASKVNVNLDQSSSNYVTTEPSAGTDNVNLVFDNTATAEGHYSVMNNIISAINTTVGTNTNVNTSGATVIDDLTLTQGVITAASTRTLSLSDIGYTGAADANKYVLPTATSVTKGGIELWDNTVQDTAAQAVTTTANRTYGIQLNGNGQAVVNVPWSSATGDGFLRSDAADTADELITFSKGINVGNLANGGIAGDNYNISGVNQITINDPGEGIIWAGTNGSDPDVTLYVIDPKHLQY